MYPFNSYKYFCKTFTFTFKKWTFINVQNQIGDSDFAKKVVCYQDAVNHVFR